MSVGYTATANLDKSMLAPVSEYTLVKFDVMGKSYTKTPAEAISLAEGLLNTAKATNIKFTEIVPCRSTILQEEITNSLPAHKIEIKNAKLTHDVHVCCIKGPLSAKDFIQLMQFEEGVSNETWATQILARKSKL